MTSSVQFNTAELRRISLRMAQLDEKVAKKGIRTAVRKAMAIVRDQVKQTAPVETGKTKANVAMRVSFKGSYCKVRIGITGGALKNPTSPYWWRMVELGTRHMPARPFMLPALEGNQQAILDKLTEELGNAV